MEISSSSIGKNCLPMGIQPIDEKLEGIEKGSVVGIIGDPKSPAPLFLYHLATTGPTKYITTSTPTSIIEKRISDIAGDRERDDDVDMSNVEFTDLQEDQNSHNSRIREKLNEAVEEGTQNIVIDTFTDVSNVDHNYRKLIQKLHKTAEETDGIIYIYFARPDVDALEAEKQEVLHACDSIFHLKTEIRGGENIYHNLIVTKFGSKALPKSTIRLDYTDEVTLNKTSRH